MIANSELAVTSAAFITRYEQFVKTGISAKAAFHSVVNVYESQGYEVPFNSFESFKTSYYRNRIQTLKKIR